MSSGTTSQVTAVLPPSTLGESFLLTRIGFAPLVTSTTILRVPLIYVLLRPTIRQSSYCKLRSLNLKISTHTEYGLEADSDCNATDPVSMYGTNGITCSRRHGAVSLDLKD
ncbi:hypothetical protein EVAR_67153_1 [Eumeta japonica]|uniref:Uncharacterized protein n=1 Tax=Eumeta variegata TaxID=151549 RepID=A0A4C1ZSW9_EUMVA|nr:hypothetical protein EVAR_67153_1 [Eumeta japonica]